MKLNTKISFFIIDTNTKQGNSLYNRSSLARTCKSSLPELKHLKFSKVGFVCNRKIMHWFS